MITENKLFGKLIAGLKFILTPVRINVRLYIFLYFLSVALCAICNLFGTHNSFFTACLLSLCECYIVCALKEAFGYIKLSWLPVIPTIVLYVSEMFVVFIYRTLYSVDVVQLMAETDSREVSNFFASTFSQPIVWIAPIVVAACVAIALAAPKFEIKKENLKPYLYFIFFALLIWGSSRQIKGYQKVFRSFMGGSLNICSVNVPRMSTPYIRFCYGLVVNNAASKEIPFLKESVERITATKNDNGCPLIVLVIGESFSKHHTPLYRTGYRSTTPFLESMRDKGNLVLFDDAISPSNITSNVFKHMFST